MTDKKKTDIIQAGPSAPSAVSAAEGYLTFTEDKGVLDSRFIVTASPEVWSRIKRAIARFNAA